MSDLRQDWSEEPLDLRRAVREGLHKLDPSLKLLAEDILGGESRIDLLAVDSAHRPVLLLISKRGDDLACLTRALALRAWVAARARDWCKLSSDLDLRPEVGVRAIVLCPAFHPETVAAARSLGTSAVELAICRGLQNGGIEKLVLAEVPSSDVQARGESGTERVPFRSGLTDADLNLSASERSAFD